MNAEEFIEEFPYGGMCSENNNNFEIIDLHDAGNGQVYGWVYPNLDVLLNIDSARKHLGGYLVTRPGISGNTYIAPLSKDQHDTVQKALDS